jgi:ribosome recycling factor
MKKSVENIQQEMAVIRTGRATPSLLDPIKVEYYGSNVPLRQVASIGAPDARLLVVQVFDRNAVANVDKAIRSAELGLNPLVEGNLLRIPIPQLTEERRRELVKYLHKIAEEGGWPSAISAGMPTRWPRISKRNMKYQRTNPIKVKTKSRN